MRVQHNVFDQISVLRKSQAEGFILTNGSKGKYNLNCRLVKQKPQKPDALACYKHLHLSVHSSNRMTSSILWELSAGFRPGASTHNHKVVSPCPSSSVILSQKRSSCSRQNTNAVSVLLTRGHPTSKNRKNALNAVYCFLISFYGLLKGYLCELTLFYLFGCGS